MKKKLSSKREESFILFTLAAVNFTHIMDFMIIMPMGDILMTFFSISPQQFSWVIASYSLTAALSGLIFSIFIDRFDRKKSLTNLYLGFIGGNLGCCLASSYPFLLVARSLTGAFGGILGALILSILGDVIPESRRGRSMGFIMAAFSLASVLGVPSGYYLARTFGWYSPFYLLLVVGLLVQMCIFYFIPSLTSHISFCDKSLSKLAIFKDIFSYRHHIFSLIFTFTLMMSHFIIIPFIAPYMIHNVRVSPDKIGYIYFFGGALTIFTSPKIGRLSDYLGKKKVFTYAAFCSLIVIVVITNLPVIPFYAVLIITTLFFVLSNSRIVPAFSMVTSSVSKEKRGRFMSINSSVQQMATSMASLISGSIVIEMAGKIKNYNYVGYISIVLCLLCIYIGQKINLYAPEKGVGLER